MSKTCYCKIFLLYAATICMMMYLCLFLISKSKVHPDSIINKKEGYDRSIPLQYRIQAEEIYQHALDLANIPKAFRTGNALLRKRTYPKTPRKPKCIGCFAYIYDNVLKPKSCDAPGDIQMLVIITTVPSVRDIRDAMRQTWLSLTKNNTASVRYLFLLGSGWPSEQHAALRKENKQFGDILQDDYIDSYFNLSIKVLSGFKYSTTVCKRAKFIMRSADDNYVNLPNVMPILQKDGKKLKDSMIGHCYPQGTGVLRVKSTKWAVTRNEWPADRYPPYCTGTTFIMTQKSTKKMYDAAQNVPYFVMEDVYFGEVARQCGITIRNYANFLCAVPKFSLKGNQSCHLHQWYRAVHNVSQKQQFLLWKFCQKTKSL